VAFVKEHLQAFEKCLVGDWQGARAPEGWIKSVGYNLVNAYPDLRLDEPANRADLFRMRDDPSVVTADLCAFIFAWGGMQVSNGKRIFKEVDWITVADGLRRDCFDHYQAYDQFFALSTIDKMPGCLPAFYTKLLFFLPGIHERGIIMDQWTSRSINLLMGLQLVRLTPLHNKSNGYRVSKDNDMSVYNNFCKAVHELAHLLGTTVEEIEMRMFSEGNGKGDWRNYVRTNS
jgi:8-oxoguanine DNA glycosylase-like protein